MSDWKQRFSIAMMGSSPTPLAHLVRGDRCHVWDIDGTRYLDFLSGIAVNALGHGHPALVDAVSKQAAELVHVSNYFSTPQQVELAERLVRLTGGHEATRVFFANSGTEANEGALKLAKLNSGDGTRTRILSLQGSFHGRSTGALALTGQSALRGPFAPLIPGIDHIEPTIQALAEAMGPDVAALFVEPIMGEAGVVELPPGYLAEARRITREAGALLILDEIQTGVGRTGHWFAFQGTGIVPDAMTLAKGLAGGVPIGALVTFGQASTLFGPGSHGTTFGGNPLAAAAANAVLGEIERADLLGNARRRGVQLREAIESIHSPLVADVRGEGLLIGIGLSAPVAKQVAAHALAHGLIVNAANDTTIRIAPPLIIGDEEIAEFQSIFCQALEAQA
ncbi:acetylornithine transaminase [Homoserinimonas sp. OAct 916]|uniref:acetylornithine transaminase n=1 Tax=Homoserinimonas sp. OAct 916 TaxID=2211450 RepID=UPI0021063453|nr:acetylornithine transaminase [Homoserinimonas sp. OAct 916]